MNPKRAGISIPISVLSRKGDFVIELKMFGGGYEWVRQLYVSAATEVHVVRHIRLGDERILKLIHRDPCDPAGQTSIHSEAEILRGLRHPGIPVLYDYGEDDECICLIEEYVRGPSLLEYFSEHQSVTISELSFIMSRLCQIIDYLHSQPTPILYQDLKPEHIILRAGEPTLIDYGISSFLGRSGDRRVFGTTGYVAPELSEGYRPDKLSDIYSLGSVAKFLSGHCSERIPGQMSSQIHLAMSDDPSCRPASAGEWRLFWDSYCSADTGSSSDLIHLPAHIAICSSYSGTGCTHIAISLVSYLNSLGRKAYYVNTTGDGVVERIYENCREYHENMGVIYHGVFRGLRCYEAGETKNLGSNKALSGMICVMDCGKRHTPVPDADITLFITGSSPWKRGMLPECFVAADHCYLLVNPASAGTGFALARDTGQRAFGFPLDPDPFRVSEKKRKLFSGILSGENI